MADATVDDGWRRRLDHELPLEDGFQIDVTRLDLNPCRIGEVDADSWRRATKQDASYDCAFAEVLDHEIRFFHTQKPIEIAHTCYEIQDCSRNGIWIGCVDVNDVNVGCHGQNKRVVFNSIRKYRKSNI